MYVHMHDVRKMYEVINVSKRVRVFEYERGLSCKYVHTTRIHSHFII